MNSVNQLLELRIHVFDKSKVSPLPPSKRVEGLCEFIRKQKDTLRLLDIRVQFVFDDDIGNILAKTIVELECLKVLNFGINSVT